MKSLTRVMAALFVLMVASASATDFAKFLPMKNESFTRRHYVRVSKHRIYGHFAPTKEAACSSSAKRAGLRSGQRLSVLPSAGGCSDGEEGVVLSSGDMSGVVPQGH
jgi:hypothetical protein